jgi:5,5'-dehydrodivanillate O-demethylase oxygenase subunit
MITKEENETWTRVGKGTPGGEMLRRYWWPVTFGSLVQGKRPKKIRLLGEDFVLFRDGNGKVGMIEPQCVHRRAPMEFGRVEADGIRCCYHGWKFDTQGKCLETPPEEPGSTLKDRVAMRSYPVQELAGLVFAYIGSAPAPLLPRYDLLVHEAPGTRYVYGNANNCNWVQTAENAADATHIPWLHAGPYPMVAAKRINIEFTEREYGMDCTTLAPGIESDKCSSLIFPSHNRFASARTEQGAARQNMIFRVPEDDTRTLNFFITFIPAKEGPFVHKNETTPERKDKGPWVENQRGVYAPGDEEWWGVTSTDQDRMVLEGQGMIYDRSTETLAASDRGVAMYRRMLRESLAAVAEGRDPKGIVRDPEKNRVIETGTRLYTLTREIKVEAA